MAVGTAVEVVVEAMGRVVRVEVVEMVVVRLTVARRTREAVVLVRVAVEEIGRAHG